MRRCRPTRYANVAGRPQAELLGGGRSAQAALRVGLLGKIKCFSGSLFVRFGGVTVSGRCHVMVSLFDEWVLSHIFANCPPEVYARAAVSRDEDR